MYYELYKSAREQVAEVFGLTVDPANGQVSGALTGGLQNIQWLGGQYESGIGATPCLLVEFLPLVVNRQGKQSEAAEIGLRLHVVSDVAVDAVGNVADAPVAAHEALAHRVLNALEDVPLTFQHAQTRPLRLSGWTHHHRHNGYMVTLIDLKTKG